VAVPANATAVTGNLTIVNHSVTGLVALGPTMTSAGDVTTINFVKADTVANNVTVGLSGDGTLSAVYRSTAGATTDVIFDVTGYFTPDTSGATYRIVNPGRVLDSRPTRGGVTNIGLAGKFRHKVVRTFQVAGAGGIGWSSPQVPVGAAGVTGNLTVTNVTTYGYVSIGPSMVSTPSTSNINLLKGGTRANGITVALNSAGQLQAVWVGSGSTSTADVIFDVTGYFMNDQAGLSYHPIVPFRILNSSINQGLTGPFMSTVPKTMPIGGVGQIEAGSGGISGNLTLIMPATVGYAYVGPVAISQPSSSTVNAIVGQNVANGFDVKISSGGNLSLVWVGLRTTSSANLQLDITGYWK
jgi:hypothetical protein